MKFTSKPNNNLTLSMLRDELEKARELVARGLAHDYIILTNHPVSGASEALIKGAFRSVGVKICRVFGYDWIVRQIKASPRLRMLAPRLYGLGDLSDVIDARAYEQAKLILSAMGDDLKKLVITDAHRESVRAISAHNFVLLLGAPASGKSTIGASLAVGAADIWQCNTIRITCPADIQRHLDPTVPQFFWIDDAWGNTQYQRQTAEAWNQIFPLMQGAMKSGTKFLVTSRDYIWRAAREDLKIQALPVLKRSQVIINVHSLSTQERAQILYNHLKLGDQPPDFRVAVKPFLPQIAESREFLPETARRFGSVFFAGSLVRERNAVVAFFAKPEQFLLDTIINLSADCRAAIALLFMNGGKVRSPVPAELVDPAAQAFGVSVAAVRQQLEALNGSLLLLARDEAGPFWTYKHPTVSDAFAKYVAGSAELVEVYLRGASPSSIAYEVVCGGSTLVGAPVIVPDTLHDLLADRIERLESHQIASFLSYRSNRHFSEIILRRRPDIWTRMDYFTFPMKDDMDADLVVSLYRKGLLPENSRLKFVNHVRDAAIEFADASFLDDAGINEVVNDDEKRSILDEVESEVLFKIKDHIDRLEGEWDKDSPPEDYFDEFEGFLRLFAEALAYKTDYSEIIQEAKMKISGAVDRMNEDYHPASPTSAPTGLSTPQSASLANVFRDVDE